MTLRMSWQNQGRQLSHLNQCKEQSMKFKAINVHNIEALVPSWAIDPFVLARQLDSFFCPGGPAAQFTPNQRSVYKPLPFWIEVDSLSDPKTVRVCTPDETVDLCGQLIITCSSPLHAKAQVILPLNPLFKSHDRIGGSYNLYAHALQTETPLTYVGLTKQRWFDRYAQHVSGARTGSHLLFHEALRQHQDVIIVHKVIFCELTYDHAMEFEEEWVEHMSLYPMGLNMIPGGKAGFSYLSSLGLQARNPEDRDLLLEQISDRESIEGRPNPLCAARWASDESYVERVICGHSGRLTAEQVRIIKLGSSFGKSLDQLMKDAMARNLRQVRNIISGRTYSRIKT